MCATVRKTRWIEKKPQGKIKEKKEMPVPGKGLDMAGADCGRVVARAMIRGYIEVKSRA